MATAEEKKQHVSQWLAANKKNTLALLGLDPSSANTEGEPTAVAKLRRHLEGLPEEKRTAASIPLDKVDGSHLKRALIGVGVDATKLDQEVDSIELDTATEHLTKAVVFVAGLLGGDFDLTSAWDDCGANAGVVMGSSADGLTVLLKPATYQITDNTKAAFVLGGEFVLDVAEKAGGSGKVIPILDLDGFVPSPSHLPLAVWMMTSAGASLYKSRLSKVLVFKCPSIAKTVWTAFCALVPESLTNFVKFVDTPEDLTREVGDASQYVAELGGTRAAADCQTVQDLIYARVRQIEQGEFGKVAAA